MFEIARKIVLKEDTFIETPLLTPSFSSKGFGFDKEGSSEIKEAFEFTKEQLTESVLFSAYDIYHKHIKKPYKIVKPDITFLDSGGYETSNFYDFSSVIRLSNPVKKWTEKFYDKIVNEWPSYLPLVIVNYDDQVKGKKIEKQIEIADEFFSKHDDRIKDILLKPIKRNESYVNIDSIVNNLEKLNKCDIVGLTEKELGPSMLRRMINIAKIRKRLNDLGIGIPIHIFGGLDPLSCIFYFVAGAEIFDGLTWLRYSYHENTAIYTPNYGVLNEYLGIQHFDSLIKGRTLNDNLNDLVNLKFNMRKFATEKNFAIFGDKVKPFLENSYEIFKNELIKNDLIKKEE